MNISKRDNSTRKSVILKKIIVLFVISVFAIAAVLAVRHYFYILDSYYYTAEFHVLFMQNNLKNANTELYAEYFLSMKTLGKVFPMLLLSYLVQNYCLLFTKPILVAAVTSAFGIIQGALLSYASLLVTGLICFSIGIFFLGDIVPLFQNKFVLINSLNSRIFITGSLFGVLFAVPFVPIAIPATLSAFIRIPFKHILVIMTIGFMIRVIWLISAPEISFIGIGKTI